MRILVALAAVPLIGCLQGQESFDVTQTQTINFPGLPPALAQAVQGARTTETHMRIDLRSTLASLGGQGDLSGVFSKNSLSGSGLAVIAHVRATISASDGTMPDLLWSEADVPADSSEIELPSSLTSEQFLKYLEEGPVDVLFTVTGDIPKQPTALTHTISGHVTIGVNEDLSKKL